MQLTATHTVTPQQAEALLSLADTHPATLVLDAPPPHITHVDPANASCTSATWYVEEPFHPPLAAALEKAGFPALVWQPVDETVDYVAQSAATFPPLALGPFFIARNGEAAPEGATRLTIPANRAFGSGEHATTAGCLAAYTALMEDGRRFSHGLDFGSGSALLAIAAAKRAGTPMLAVDNDPIATDIGQHNAEANGVESLVTCFTADTPLHPQVQAQGPYPLIFANILLAPLLELATPLMDSLADGGALILSGFTTPQEADIAAAYAALTPAWRKEQAGWLTLAFTKP